MKSKTSCAARKRIFGGVAAALLSVPLLLAWKSGDQLPPLTGFNLEGQLPATAGKVVLIDFWASWCGPCKKSFPELDKLQRTFAGKDFLLLAVCVDEKAADMAAFLKAHPVGFAVVRDVQQQLVAAAGVESMPTSLLVDRQGHIRAVHAGFRGPETVQQLTAEIDQLLTEK